MNYFSFFRKAKALKKAVTVVTLLAFLSGGVSGIAYTSTAHANNGINTYATPSTGTLVAGQALDVHMTVALDPNDTNPITSPTCLVNGVEVKDTFQNLTTGTDGHFMFTYTVGTSDTDRAAGTVPISCTLQQTGSVTITGFDDGNTVAIDAVPDEPSGGTGTTTPPTGGSGTTTPPSGGSGTTTPPNSGLSASATPSSGTLTAGDALVVSFGDPSGTSDAVSSTCLVNGVETKDSFVNISPGLYQTTYTVSAGDTDRAAGTLPLDCTISQAVTVQVNTWTDGNTVAIDAVIDSGTGTTTPPTGGSGTTTPPSGGSGTTTLPTLSSISIIPSSGSISLGQTADVFFTEASGQTDLSVMGSCKVNMSDVSSTFANLGSGNYKVTYTVGSGDGERPAGWTLLNCTLGNANGTTTATHPWSDGNTLAIDTNGDGNISNGTSTLGFTTSAQPSTGMLGVGDALTVWFQDPLPSPNLVVGSTGCSVNNVDVASTFTHTSNGLYRVTYTVGESHIERAAGQIPVDCSMQNDTGSVRLVSFTDGNTVGIDMSAGGSGTTTPAVGAGLVPSAGVFTAGQNLEVYLEVPGENFLTIKGVCLVNNKNVTATFQNFTGGLYRVIYPIVPGDSEREAGEIPVQCTLEDEAGTFFTANAWTDGNTVAIDTDNDGIVVEPTGTDAPFIAGVFANPASGTLGENDTLEVYLQEGTGEENFTPGVCAVNESDSSSTFQNLTSGFYLVTYTVSSEHAERAAGEIPFNCAIGRTGGPVLQASAFTDGNTVAIDLDGSGTGTTTPPTGGSGTTTPPTGGTGTTTPPTDGGSGSTGTTTPPTGGSGTTTPPSGGSGTGSSSGSTTTISFSSVTANPNSGMRYAGDHLFVHFQSATNATDLSIGGACTVNGVTMTNLEHLNLGHYRVDYSIGSSDTERAAGTVPVSCVIQDSTGASSTVTAFTDANTVAIDTNHDGLIGGAPTNNTSGGSSAGNSTTTPVQLSWVSITPSAGTISLGQSAQVYFQEYHNMTDLTLNGACSINDVSIGSLDNLGNGLYRLNYTVGASHADRIAGAVPVNCLLRNSHNQTTQITVLDSNTLAIDVNGNGSYSDGLIGGSVQNGFLGVSSITQVKSSATAGGGYEQGWAWNFNVTVPSNEDMVRMKFGDWTHTDGTTMIQMEENMRISSEQASSTASVTMTAAGTYSSAMEITGDLDPATPGRQIQIRVEMQVPAGTASGSYGTYYGIQSTQE